MKRLAVFVVFLGGVALATDFFPPRATVSLSSASAVNTDTMPGGEQISLSCDGEIRYATCSTTSNCTVDATGSRLSNFDLPVDICLPTGHNRLSLIRTGSTTVTCYVADVRPKQCKP